MSKKCYFCGAEAVSKEHVPPKCLFPTKKRKNLIVVPSCDIHNMQKSDDDEYFKFILSINFNNNISDKEELSKSVIRAAIFSPKLYKNFAKFSQPIILKTPSSKILQIATPLDVDIERYHRILKSITHGIYFHIFNKQLEGTIEIIFDQNIYLDDSNINMNIYKQTNILHGCFSQIGYKGNNQDVFKYSYYKDKDFIYLEYIFYEGIQFIVSIKENG